jgi:hypothetical protein
MALFGQSKKNMLAYDVFDELADFYYHTMKMNLTLANGTVFQFPELCHPLCAINDQILKLMVSLSFMQKF